MHGLTCLICVACFGCLQTKPNPMFTYKMPSSDVTIYADEYVKSNGTGPYNTKAQ